MIRAFQQKVKRSTCHRRRRATQQCSIVQQDKSILYLDQNRPYQRGWHSPCKSLIFGIATSDFLCLRICSGIFLPRSVSSESRTRAIEDGNVSRGPDPFTFVETSRCPKFREGHQYMAGTLSGALRVQINVSPKNTAAYDKLCPTA